jgi:surface antigen
MGGGGTRNATLGRAAVIRLRFLVPAALAVLSACANNSTAENSAGPIGGAAVGLGVAGITADPFVAYAAGVGAQAAITALQKYLSRKVHQGEQNDIAATAGALQPGQSAPWQIRYEIPIDREHGDLTVIKTIDSSLATCKQVAFTVIAAHATAIYITSVCRDSDGAWQWAQSEPAVARWGFLQ